MFYLSLQLINVCVYLFIEYNCVCADFSLERYLGINTPLILYNVHSSSVRLAISIMPIASNALSI